MQEKLLTQKREESGDLGLAVAPRKDTYGKTVRVPWNSPVAAVVGETLNLCRYSSSGFIFYWASFVERIPVVKKKVKNQFRALVMRKLTAQKRCSASHSY